MQGQMLKDLPLDAISNIQSFLIGKPNDLRLKNNKKFVELQRLFKINYSKCKFMNYGRAFQSSYKITGSKLNLNIILKQKDRLCEMWQDTYKSISNIGSGDYSTYIHIHAHTKNRLYHAEDFDLTDGVDDEEVNEFLNEAKSEIEYHMNEKQDNEKVSINLSVWFEF